jgi:long-chain acyl-CoA synthetase
MPSLAEVHAQLTAPGSMFEVAEGQVAGIPTRVWKNTPNCLRTVLTNSRLHGDKTFLVYEGERLSFAEHFRAAAHLARILREEWGVEKGDRVAIAMRNYPEWPVAFFGAAAAGAVVVPLNSWWTGAELEYGLKDSGAKVLFADPQRAESLAPHLGDKGLGDKGPADRGPAGLSLEKIVTVRGTAPSVPGALRFEDAVGTPPEDASLPDVELAPDDDATLFYTSGTTGRPKGALGSQRNICSNMVAVAFVAARSAARSGKPLPPPGERPQSASLVSVPFFHATGCHAILCGNLAFGGKLVMMYKWDAEKALELIEKERLTSFGGVPAMVWQVLESPSFGRYDVSSVNSVGYGGAPAAPDLVRRIREAFGDVVSPGNGYGLTETSSITTYNGGADYVRKPESVGAPIPVCEVKAVDSEGKELPPGQVGELWIKGPNVVKGYWNKPEASAESFSDGWLHSGDLGRIDDEGFVFIVDRAKDMLIRGGENIYCVEVESVLYEHPAVMDAAVIGIPHKVLGEEVGAVVQRTPGAAVDEEELKQHVGRQLAAFKVPVRIEIRDEPLPRNANGKILKQELREGFPGAA